MLKLMIVDDSNIIRNKITRAHNQNQFQLVATAKTGKEALDMFEKTRPSVITMDLTMPEMDGLECIERIMAIDPEVAILVVSALSDKATGIQAIKLGARGFLLKPFTEKALDEALMELTESTHV